MVTKAWKVFGQDGHMQRESFNKSHVHDFSNEEDGTRIIAVHNSDKTGTNEYSVVIITRDTKAQCEKEFWGHQLSDGIFKNSITGKIVSL